jgi:hypothetical protein
MLSKTRAQMRQRMKAGLQTMLLTPSLRKLKIPKKAKNNRYMGLSLISLQRKALLGEKA